MMGDRNAQMCSCPQEKENPSFEDKVRGLQMENYQLRAELAKMAALLDEERAETASWKARFWNQKLKELEESKTN